MRMETIKKIDNVMKTQNINDGVVIMGTGDKYGNKPEILAHELGHAQNHKEHPYLGSLRNPFVTTVGSGLGGALIANSHPVAGGALIALSHGGTLYDEGKASYRGYQNLKNLGYEPSKKDLSTGFGSYVLNAAAPAAVGTALYHLKN